MNIVLTSNHKPSILYEHPTEELTRPLLIAFVRMSRHREFITCIYRSFRHDFIWEHWCLKSPDLACNSFIFRSALVANAADDLSRMLTSGCTFKADSYRCILALSDSLGLALAALALGCLGTLALLADDTVVVAAFGEMTRLARLPFLIALVSWWGRDLDLLSEALSAPSCEGLMGTRLERSGWGGGL